MRGEDLLLVEHVQVDHRAAHVEVPADERADLRARRVVSPHAGVHVELQRRGVAVAALHLCHRVSDGRRRVSARPDETRIGIRAVGDGRARVAAVRRRADCVAHADRRGPREDAGDHVEPGRRGLLLDEPRERLRNAPGVVVGARAAAAEARDAVQHEARGLRVREVRLQQVPQLLPAEPAFLHDALLDCGERIGHRRQRGAVDAHVVVLHAAVGDIASLLDGAVAEQIQRQFGEDVLVVRQMEVDSFGGDLDGAAQVRFETRPQLVD